MIVENASDLIRRVELRLEEWAEWLLTEKSCSTHLLAKVQMLGIAGAAIRGHAQFIGIAQPREIAEVEIAVSNLPTPEWRQIVLLEYFADGSQEKKSSSIGISVSKYKRDLRESKIFIAPILGIDR